MARIHLRLIAVLAGIAAGQEIEVSGRWDARISVGGDGLPFKLVIVRGGHAYRAFMRNAEEEVEAPAFWQEGELTIEFAHYDSRIVALPRRGDPNAFDGHWRKRRGPDQWSELSFSMTRDLRDAGTTIQSDATEERPDSFAGTWKVAFSSSPDVAVGIFSRPYPGSKDLRATFLTTTGDFRYLHGFTTRTQLRLACFDGAHAFRFEAMLQADGTLSGNFYSGDDWSETWTARKVDAAALPDPLAEVRCQDGANVDQLVFPDLDGTPVSLGGPDLKGKPRVIEIFGSWCPNCHDEAKLLADLDRRYRERGLRIVGLAFEVTGDPVRDAAQVRRYALRHGVSFPLLLAGPADKSRATKALKLLDRVKAYPTTIFVRKDGTVRATWSGFSGPATGVEHARLRERFEALIEEIVR